MSERRRPAPAPPAPGDFLADAFDSAPSDGTLSDTAASDTDVLTEPGEPARTALSPPTSPAVAREWVAPDYRTPRHR